MKKIDILVMAVCGIMCIAACDDLTDEGKTNSDSKLLTYQSTVDEIADEYGLDNVKINPDSAYVYSYSRNQIEAMIKDLSQVRGKYILKLDNRSHKIVSQRPMMLHKRAPTPYNETYKGHFSEDVSSYSTGFIRIDVSYEYSNRGSCWVKVSVDPVDANNWSITGLTYNFTGSAPSFTFSATLEHTGTYRHSYRLTGDYDASSGKGTIDIN